MKFPTKDKIIITVAVKKKRLQQSRRGLILPDEDTGIIPRRKTDNNIYVKLYDWAQYANGTDVAFLQQRQLTGFLYVANFPADNLTAFPVLSDPQDTSDFSDIVLADDPDTFHAAYKEITEDLDDYSLTVTNLGGFVENKGLPLDEGQSTFIIDAGSPYFPANIIIGSTSGYKYTTEPNYSASSATFTLDKSCDVFLAPRFFTNNTDATHLDYDEAQTDAGNVFPYVPFTSYIPYIYLRPLSRSLTLGNSNWANIWANRAAFFPYPGITTASRAYFRSLVYGDIDMYVSTVTAEGSVSPSTASASGYPTSTSGTWQLTPRASLIMRQINVGTCVAAIRKKLGASSYQWYFQWATALKDNVGEGIRNLTV